MKTLPIDGVLPELLAALESAPCAVLEAPTGAGKTTRVPPALLDAGYGPVVVLEPRRLAARAAARWIARERGARLGGEVGYQVRFDSQRSRETRLVVVTEGILLRMLQDDPFLEGYGVVVIDEFHERSLQADLALALVRRVQTDAREDLRLVVMSATLEGQAVAAALGGCPVIRSQGRSFPVDIEHLASDDLVAGVRAALDRTDGDLLVFLPGVGEIRRAADDLAGLSRARDFELHELFGDLPPERQDAVLLRGERRKVVLTTNVAETSITVDGVTGVVDTGSARVLTHDPAVGLDRLELAPISVASADQRAGRAGRQQPGICLRLWSAHDHKTRAPREVPALRRLDLSGVALQLACWGERDLSAFPWFEAPPPESLARAVALLERLGALGEHGPTSLGRSLARLPVAPRLGKLLVEGQALGIGGRAALAAALLSERDPFERPARYGPRVRVTDSDVLDRVEALEAFAGGARDPGPWPIRAGAARFVLRAARQFERLLGPADDTEPVDADAALGRALLSAFPDRLCRRRAEDAERAVMVGGRGVRLGRESGVTMSELFVAVDLDGARGEARVRLASAVQREWLGEPREVISAVFDPARQRVVGRRELRLGELAIEVTEHASVDAHEAALLLAVAAEQDLARALDLDQSDFAELRDRIAWLASERPELELPAVDEAGLIALLPELCAGRRSFADLRRAPLVGALRGRLDHRQRAALEREAPERIQVPTGSHLKLAYEVGRAPVLAVRIQELFGLAETPTLAAGRVRVLLHLLAPNGRPQQVTDDLASFWANTYPQVRKDLRGRYPKHSWPTDPLAAPPRSRPGRRRGGAS